MNLILFTSTYPFDGGAEQTFLDQEIQCLNRVFDRIILVPKKIVGECLSLPEGVSVEKSYAELLGNASPLLLARKTFGSSLIYRELISHPSFLFHPQAIKRMVRFMA